MSAPPRSPPGLVERTIKNCIAGTTAGIAVCLVGHPFDTLKVRLQTQPTNNPVYRGLTDCFFKTLKWEGVGGLYRGVASPIIGQMFFRATLFTSYYQVQDALSQPDRAGRRLQPAEYFLCGAVTGFLASFIEGPIDLFKTKMQIQIIRAKSGAEVQYRNVFHAGYLIGRHHGVKGVYQGLGATIARDAPAFGVYFGVYELVRTALTPPGDAVSDLSVGAMLLSGGAGGLLYWVAIYPVDVIKSTMQSDEMSPDKRRYKNMADCAWKLYVHEGGWRRFYKGFTPCIMRAVPANATQLFVMEKCRQVLF